MKKKRPIAVASVPEILVTITGQQGIGKSTLAAAFGRLLADFDIECTTDGFNGNLVDSNNVDSAMYGLTVKVRIVTSNA